MLEVAAKNLGMHDITLVRTDGANLPYPAQAVDISFTVTVLQHNTDDTVFKRLVQELCILMNWLKLPTWNRPWKEFERLLRKEKETPMTRWIVITECLFR